MSEFTALKGLDGAYRRHIVIDNIQKVIYIEVQWSITGELKVKEAYEIMNGLWYNYVPKAEINQFRQCIEGGYRVEAVWNSGASNVEFYIIQIAGMEAKKPVVI